MHKLYLLGLVILLTGCSLSGDDEIVVSTVQPELRLDLANPLELESDFAFRLTTTSESCSTSKLLADGIIENDQVNVQVSGLLIPSSCAGDRLLIGKDIEVGIEERTYDVSITIGEELSNTGTLTYDGAEYYLTIEEPHGLIVGHNSLRKIPEDIVWGELSGETNLEQIVGDFHSVASAFTAPLNLINGYYGHFAVESGSGINLTASIQETSGYSYPFVYRLKSGTDAFKDVLDTFRSQYGTTLEITCTTWTGEQL
jgi:hypothetical protein